ncbi:MAG: FAD-dependent oxidoreductase [Caulobacteraceae bacterium]|nr:FAD-dependent oxidoreductase [Caulobacteraceae bacterium]
MGGNVVILGAGHAGGSAAALLRQFGYEGHIVMVGDEPLAPYQRPPLSKAWLKGEADGEALALRPEEFYAENDIDFRAGVTATKIVRGGRTVELSDGSSIPYEHLIIATGARAIRLAVEGADLDGVMVLRTAADAEELKHRVGPGKRVAVVGGGYIGLEVAASARALGAEAVVIEREARVLARVACPALSTFVTGYHKTKGVAFELEANVGGFAGEGGKLTGVKLGDGRTIACDVAVVGVGAIPNDELASDAGLETARGVVVDDTARTADPAIFAIGDVTHRPLPIYERMFRLESVQNALEQARQAAAIICGRPPPAPEAPWNWSDQYDLKLQMAGLPFEADATIVRGDPATAKFAVFHLKGDQIQAVEAVNAPPEFMAGKQFILNRKPVSRDKLADTSISMKEVGA